MTSLSYSPPIKPEIYGIRFKGESKILYVGLASHGADYRYKRHLSTARASSNLPPERQRLVCRWLKENHEQAEVIVLEKCNTVDELDEREIYWIEVLDTYYRSPTADPDVLNMTPGGSGWHIRDSPSEDTKKLLSEATRKYWEDPTNRENRITSLVSSWATTDRREKMAAVQSSSEYKKQNRVARRRAVHTRYHANQEILRPSVCDLCQDLLDAGSTWQVILDRVLVFTTGNHRRWHTPPEGGPNEDCGYCTGDLRPQQSLWEELASLAGLSVETVMRATRPMSRSVSEKTCAAVRRVFNVNPERWAQLKTVPCGHEQHQGRETKRLQEETGPA